MQVTPFYDSCSGTFTYVLVDAAERHCAIIDSVLNYDQFTGHFHTRSADAVIQFIEQRQLRTQWILETHMHADHITAAHYLKQQLGGEIAMGSGVKQILDYWIPVFESEQDTCLGGTDYDVLFEDGDGFAVGDDRVTVWHTPGHTPACVSYLIAGAIFVGDTLFAPHLGTARCDFPGGSAEQLYQTIQRFYSLPDDTCVYLAHDYPKKDEKALAHLSLGLCKQSNKMLNADTTLAEFVTARQARDAQLAVPKMLYPAIQANMRNGRFGQPSDGGKQFIKVPVSAL